LGEDGVFEFWVIAAEGGGGCNALYGGVEFFEEFFGDAGGDFGAVAPTHHVFIGDNDAMGFTDRGRDGFPVIGRERAEVDDFYRNAIAFESGGGDFGTVDDGAVGDDADLGALFDQASFAERNGVIGAGILGAVVGLAIEMLVLEEHDRVVAADGGA